MLFTSFPSTLPCDPTRRKPSRPGELQLVQDCSGFGRPATERGLRSPLRAVSATLSHDQLGEVVRRPELLVRPV